jgi:hypothetical protein
MILRHLRRKQTSRPRKSGRERQPQARGSDIIIVMMAILLVLACAFKILIG